MHFSHCKNWAKYIFVFQGFPWCTNEYMSKMFCSAEKQKGMQNSKRVLSNTEFLGISLLIT